MLDRPRICQYPAARVLVAVLFLLQAGAFAQSQAPMVPSPALLTNERHPLPGTVTGGVPAGDGSVPVYQALANSGVRTVIDLRTEAEVPTETALLAAAAGLDYRRLPVAGEAELDLASARALDLLLDDWSRYPVAVVCGSGNRAGALLAVRAFWLDGARPDADL